MAARHTAASQEPSRVGPHGDPPVGHRLRPARGRLRTVSRTIAQCKSQSGNRHEQFVSPGFGTLPYSGGSNVMRAPARTSTVSGVGATAASRSAPPEATVVLPSSPRETVVDVAQQCPGRYLARRRSGASSPWYPTPRRGSRNRKGPVPYRDRALPGRVVSSGRQPAAEPSLTPL